MVGIGIGITRSGGATLARIFALMQSQRVDFVGIGDSNQIYSGTGWDHGFQKALIDAGINMYATGLISADESGGAGSGTGYGYAFNASIPDATFANTGAPAALHDFLDKGSGGLNPHKYGYLASGTITWGTNTGFGIDGTIDPLDNTAALVFDFHYGTFDSGSGSFACAVRLDVSPYTQLATSSVINTNTGSFGMERETLSITADVARSGKNLAGRWTKVSTDITGPFFGLYMRASNPARTSGFSYHTLNYRGGQSLRTMAYDLQQMSDTALGYFFGECRRLQGSNKAIVICVNSGLNDRNETLTSVGTGAVSDGDSAAAFTDNFDALKTRIEAIWSDNSWSTDELYWLVFVSPPVSDPDDAELISYRAAIQQYLSSVPQSVAVDLLRYTNEAEMLAEGWYASGGADRSHLTQSGYEAISAKFLKP